jgi:hypothetical protein
LPGWTPRNSLTPGAEDPAHAGLGHRLARRRPAHYHEALSGGQAARPLQAQMGRQFREERAIDRGDPLLAALAHHTDPAQPHVDICQPKAPHLSGPKPAEQHQQDHRPVTARSTARP